MADGGYFKNLFIYDSAADCPISVKFYARKQFFSQIFGNGIDTGIPRNVFFCFPYAVWASASGGFRIVSDTLVL